MFSKKSLWLIVPLIILVLALVGSLIALNKSVNALNTCPGSFCAGSVQNFSALEKTLNFTESGRNSKLLGEVPTDCKLMGGFDNEIIYCPKDSPEEFVFTDKLILSNPETNTLTITLPEKKCYIGCKNDDKKPKNPIITEPPIDDDSGENNCVDCGNNCDKNCHDDKDKSCKNNNGNHYGNDKDDENPKDSKNKHDGENSYEDHHDKNNDSKNHENKGGDHSKNHDH